MDTHIKQQSQIDDINSAQKSLTKAGRDNETLNNEHRRGLEKYIDKILFYSASVFSFSLALLNIAGESKTPYLSQVGLLIPNVYWLYASWFLYLVSCISALLNKKLDAYYLSNYGMANWLNHKLALENKVSDFVQSYPNQIVVEQGIAKYTQISSTNRKKYNFAIKRSKRNETIFYMMSRFFFVLCELSALSATITLFIFAIQLSQAVVWRSN